MQVAILAGGLATRLRGLTGNRPKSLLEFQGKPFLEYQLELLKAAGIREVVLCIGHLGEQIRERFGDGQRYGVRISYGIEKRPLGTAGALKNAEPLLADVFFTMYGDSYLSLDFGAVMRHFKQRNKLALMTVYRNHDRFDRSNTAIEGDLVTKYSKGERTADMVYIDYGTCLFRRQVLEDIPAGQYYSLEELFPRLIAARELLAFEVSERFYEIGSPGGYAEFAEYIRQAS